MRGVSTLGALVAVALGLAPAVPAPPPPRLDPGAIPAEPTYVRAVAPALVGLHVRADARAASSARLGRQRFGTGIVFDPRGYAVTASYVVTDAVAIDARLRDGRAVAARLVGLDLETGLGVVRLAGPGPWPAARFGDSRDVAAGELTGTVGVDEDDALVHVTGRIQAVRRFSAFWEYMLDRAFLVAPGNATWAGSAVVDAAGRVIAIASLRLGEPPHVNLAIPVEKFLPVKDELVAAGRVQSRPARPWLGLYTAASAAGVVVDGFSPVGPAARAGFRPGDRIVAVNGVAVVTQEEFYEQLWRGRAGDVVHLAVEREAAVHVISVRSMDRYDTIRRPAP